MKKAQGLPLNTIIIAALVLIVLVVLTLIFTGRINMFGKGLDYCEGDCVQTATCTDGTTLGYYKQPCKDVHGYNAEDKYCCKQ